MPIYEYECQKCEKIHEVMQKFSDAPLEICEACGGTVKKKMSLTQFSLKGSGWYSTDYKKPASSLSSSAANSSAPASAEKASPPPAVANSTKSD